MPPKVRLTPYSVNLAAGWAEYGITVNCIGPIITETEMMKPIFEKIRRFAPALLPEFLPAAFASRSDCAGIAMFLASDAAEFVTGQIIYADGGLCYSAVIFKTIYYFYIINYLYIYIK
jgi:NAD(P)-dependent dehydrogenase (short-subunit alcohol dehydrogenase family)